MKKTNLHGFIHFGASYQYVRLSCVSGARYHGDGYLKQNIEGFLEFIQSHNMKVSWTASLKLRKIKEKLEKEYLTETQTLSQKDAQELNDAVDELKIVILSEAQELNVFMPAEKRYNGEMLYGSIDKIFGTSSFAKLPLLAQKDFEQAGKAIMVELPTSAAYHLMRVAECALKELYLSIVKKGRRAVLTWGSMADHLVQRRAIDDALKGTLDNFRRGFRNPTAHPEKFYSIDEAQDLLGTTTQLVGLIVSHPRYAAPTNQSES